ncbi:sel1 repeat family protein [Moraxella nasibovis]|uniref:tetratricopeptide repeat protein n=1 Tax=Moraxella nasibovis TaxID=2904120 RepID=UPI00240EF0FE|nr:tetratricopeptide repeat protein [Moraxella nasibovis]WFF38085.1 sel1 repeat family protein [Moraxella nasibovis]
MKMLKIALLPLALGTAVLSHAQTTTTTSSFESSNFERMDINSLTARAAQGNHHAQFFLAKRLQKGEGVAKDPSRAAYWYTRAAEQNASPAQLNLGLMYLRGEGVKANMNEARKWLEKAAHLGDNRASYALAVLDEREKRLVDAYKWYDLSSRDGMLDQNIKNKAQTKIGQLALNLSSKDIEKAKTSANNWFQNR